jgi:ketosteroid isomerase-like protein
MLISRAHVAGPADWHKTLERTFVMPAQENIQLVRDLFHAMDTPGPESEDAMMKMLDENISWYAVPWDRMLSGRDEVLAVVRKTWESAPSHPITHIFADGEWVCLEYVLEGTKKGGRMLFHDGDVPGGKLSVPGASIFHVKNGKIDIAREYIDRLTMFTQLGVNP